MITFKYTKTFPANFLSHLDTARSIERAMLRAEIKIEKSQGFNPHPLLYFGLPIPLGTSSTAEYCTVVTDHNKQDFVTKFNKVAPNGIKILSAFTLNKNPNVAKYVSATSYFVEVEDIQKHKQKITDLLNQKEFIAEHKTKKGVKLRDLKPFVLDFEIGENMFKVTTKSGNENLRPDKLLEAVAEKLNIKLEDFTVTKQDSFVLQEDKYESTDKWLTKLEEEVKKES